MEGESRSTTVNTSMMESRGFRQTMDMSIEVSPGRCCTVESETWEESSPLPTCSPKKKERKTVLDRLTIVSVETASTKKKRKGRRKHAPRNHKPLPEDVVLQPGYSGSISNIPDSFSGTFDKEEDDTELKCDTYDQVPMLFTFDLIPSFSEDSPRNEDSVTNDTENANIGQEDDLSGIFDEFDDSDDECVRDMEEKYSSEKRYTDTNDETLAALSKLELTTRTRTESTAFLSETSTNDMSTQLDKENEDQVFHDKASLFPENDIQVEASNLCSFNIFAMFD